MKSLTSISLGFHWLTLLAISSPLGAAVSIAGIPQPPTPAPAPVVWLALQDDLLGDSIINTDDFRTGGAHLDLYLFGALLAIDGSELTNRGKNNDLPPSRTDELTYTLGYPIFDNEVSKQDLTWLMIVGGGGRTYGNLSGERMQNAIHRASGFPLLRLPYDAERKTVAVGYAYGRSLYLPVHDLPSPFPDSVGLQMEGAALTTSGGEQEQLISASMVGLGSQGVIWMGAQFQRNAGTAPTLTADIVANHESGWWLQAGIGRTPGIYLTAAVNPRTNAIDGNIGFSIQPSNGAVDSSKLPVDEMLEMYAGGGAIGAQLRWQISGGERGALLGVHHEILLDYHFGEVPHYTWVGNRIDEDQLVVGYEPVLEGAVPGIPWLISEEFIYVAGGVRIERVEVLETPSRFLQTTSTALVAQGGGGVRIGFNFWKDPTLFINQIRFGLGWDGWIPLRQQRVSNGTDSDSHLKPGASAVLSLGFAVIW